MMFKNAPTSDDGGMVGSVVSVSERGNLLPNGGYVVGQLVSMAVFTAFFAVAVALTASLEPGCADAMAAMSPAFAAMLGHAAFETLRTRSRGFDGIRVEEEGGMCSITCADGALASASPVGDGLYEITGMPHRDGNAPGPELARLAMCRVRR